MATNARVHSPAAGSHGTTAAPRTGHQKGSALGLLIGGVAALAGLGVLGATLYSSRPAMNSMAMVAAARARHAYAGEPTPMQLTGALARAGLAPEPLAAAGVGPESVAALVSAARAALHDGELVAADADTRKARADVDRLRRAVSTGAATDQKAALDTALVALATAQARAQTALDAVFTAATPSLTAEQRTALLAIRNNRPWSLPTRYLAENRAQADWVTLRDALSNQRGVANLGDDPNPDLAAALNDADSASAAVQANLNNTGIDVANAFHNAVGM